MQRLLDLFVLHEDCLACYLAFYLLAIAVHAVASDVTRSPHGRTWAYTLYRQPHHDIVSVFYRCLERFETLAH